MQHPRPMRLASKSLDVIVGLLDEVYRLESMEHISIELTMWSISTL